ncbi:MAG: hypothetical protein ACOC5D_03670 [Thermoplasmatota archaeon]
MDIEKRLAVILSKPLDADVGRNEKIRSRLKHFEEEGWDIDIHVVKDPGDGNLLLNFLMVIFRSLMVAMDIISNSGEEKTVIWSMNSPAFLHLPALLVKLLKHDIKWVAEFRDAMCTEPFYSTKSFGRRLMRSLLEGPTVKSADKILKGKGHKVPDSYFKINYPKEYKKVSQTAYQGYHKEEFNGIEPKNFEKYTITYAGRLYDEWITPTTFLKGFARFVKEYDISTEYIQVLFYVKGWKKEYDELSKELGVADYLKINGFVSSDQIKRIIAGSDLLLYISGSKISNKNMINSKFWDYIESRRPLLVLTEKNSTISDFVNEFNLGYLAEEYDIQDISDKLFKAYDEEHKGYDNVSKLDEKFDRKLYNKNFYREIEEL